MTKQRFTKEFEREAVRLAQTSGRTRRAVADDRGIGLSTLTRTREALHTGWDKNDSKDA